MRARGQSVRRSQDEVLLHLIDLVYEAALDPTRWHDALSALVSATGSIASALTLHDLGSATRHTLWWVNADPELIAEDESWAAKNPFIAAGASRITTGYVTRSHEVISSRDVKRTEYFHEYLRRVDFLNHIGACIVRERDVSSMLFLPRRIRDEPHDPEDVALVRAILPHLQRALAIHRRFETVSAFSVAASEVLDHLPFGVVLLGTDRCAQLVNRVASEILASNDGLVLGRLGTVQATCPSNNATLGRLVAGACTTGAGEGVASGGTTLVRRPSGKQEFAVLVTPLRDPQERLGLRRPAAALFVTDPERDAGRPHDVLSRLYGFTPAEATVAALLLAGKRVADIVDELSVTANTARTHVKRILAKAGCRTQAELVRLLLSGPATLVPPHG